jgi:hypothetical protein
MNYNTKKRPNEEGVLGWYTVELSPTITVTRPILTDEEREKRMAAIKKAAVDLVIAAERAKAKREREARGVLLK